MAQDSRHVSEPVVPQVCATLRAELTPHDGLLTEVEERQHRDTARIEAAMASCGAGKAVLLVPGSVGQSVFLVGPMRLREGVTLVVGKGVGLWGSRDARDYDVALGSCGIVAEARGPGCKPLILAERASHSGLMGPGVVDGRGGAKLLGQSETWWELAHRAKVEDTNQAVSRILVVRNTDDFTLYNVTLRNSPNCHVSTEHVHGFTAWAVMIDTPKWARNTDGIDPSADTSDITIAHSYIRSGDDNISPKSTLGVGPVTRMSVYDTHFYNGHGFGIGSQTSGGISHVLVQDLSIDGSDNGLRIKSDRSRGGLVEDVRYQRVCIRNSPNPIVLNPFYTTLDGTKIPVYRGIWLEDVHVLTPGLIRMRGLDKDHELDASLSNVVVDGLKSGDIEASFASFWITPIAGNVVPDGEDVKLVLSSQGGAAYDCRKAFPRFPADVTPVDPPVSAELVPPADETFYVAADGTGDYYSVQAAVRRVPASGGLVLVAPGTYRESVTITQAHVVLKSSNLDGSKTVIAGAVVVSGDDFRAENVTFAGGLSGSGVRREMVNVRVLGGTAKD